MFRKILLSNTHSTKPHIFNAVDRIPSRPVCPVYTHLLTDKKAPIVYHSIQRIWRLAQPVDTNKSCAGTTLRAKDKPQVEGYKPKATHAPYEGLYGLPLPNNELRSMLQPNTKEYICHSHNNIGNKLNREKQTPFSSHGLRGLLNKKATGAIQRRFLDISSLSCY